MKKIAFTICAKNYLGLAQVLEASINIHNDDIDFFIFIADEFEGFENLPDNVIICKKALNITLELWDEMSFKYDLTEFCTAIKPFCFSHLSNKFGPDTRCLYFDPDIAVFNSLDSIFNKLSTESIFLTPHLVTLEENYSGTLKENKFLYSGMFNLGFIGLKFDEISNGVIDWWKERLKFGCFKSQGESYFTDQKWMDFLPILCPKGLFISFDLGNNLAPWNFYERKIMKFQEKYIVINRINGIEQYDLNFVHFSGYDYSSLIDGLHLQNNISSFVCPEDILPLLSDYESLLKSSNFNKFSNFKYSYNYYNDGSYITEYHRRCFRRLNEDFGHISMPFDKNEFFYQNLKNSKLIFESSSNIIYKSEVNPSNRKKIVVLNYLFLCIFKILGQNNYFNLLKILRRYSILENQIFLFDKSFINKSDLRK